MKNELDSKFILQVFELIRQQGEKQDDVYVFKGVTASSDFDGYTLFLRDHHVQLSFGFHNQYHLDYEKDEHLEQFINKLKTIKTQA
ncbi:MAG: DUF3081 domain-containing protein [Paraglaciecola sp.]|nr:DUF3081 domain-containing protein [Paraglaciecola sp.]NCT46778.1 DUF3081 domain-containing protein [Paraglaciecola sp.]